MSHPKYLHTQSNRLYFRRRVPGLSTIFRPALTSLRTKDRNKALIWLRTLTIEFETVFDSFAFLVDPLPDDLLHSYMQLRLKQSVRNLQRESRI